MKVVPFIYNDIDEVIANTYVVINNNECVVVDPSQDNDGIIAYLLKNELTPKAVLLTHGHFDHIRGVDRLVNKFSIPVYIGFYDLPKLKDTFTNCSAFADGLDIVVDSKAETVADNDILSLLDDEIVCVETPFHTNGSICYYFKNSGLLFTGDFLFKGSVGRSDLPTARPREFDNSIAKIMKLPDDVKVYPGHGGFTSIGIERVSNRFVK